MTQWPNGKKPINQVTMTQSDFFSILKKPASVNTSHIAELKEMIAFYPYFVQPKVLLAKVLHASNSIHSQKYIDKVAFYYSDHRWLYYYLYPEKTINTEIYRHDRIPKFAGNYFDLLQITEAEGGDSKQSLKNLAERLKIAREEVLNKDEKLIINAEQSPQIRNNVHIPTPDYFKVSDDQGDFDPEITEENAKKLIREKEYLKAIEILKKLNLINPKKSIYFADQIRFLEKVLINSKK